MRTIWARCSTPYRSFRSRAIVLTAGLALAYGVIVVGYLAAVRSAVDLAADPQWASAWPLVVLLASSTAAVLALAVNLAFDLLRVIVVSDDCGVGMAVARLRAFVLADARQVLGLIGVVGGLLTLAAAVSVLATAALVLVGWVPVIGLIVVPLQIAAWVVRGVIFQYLSLAALAAYQTQYRRFAERYDAPAAPRPFRVHA